MDSPSSSSVLRPSPSGPLSPSADLSPPSSDPTGRSATTSSRPTFDSVVIFPPRGYYDTDAQHLVSPPSALLDGTPTSSVASPASRPSHRSRKSPSPARVPEAGSSSSARLEAVTQASDPSQSPVLVSVSSLQSPSQPSASPRSLKRTSAQQKPFLIPATPPSTSATNSPTRRPSPVTGEKRIDLPKKPFYPAPLLVNDTNVAKWPSTPGFQAFWGWLSQRCRRIRGKPMRNEEYQGSCSAIGSLLDILDHMEDWVSEIPPLPQNNMRFGNLAFRQYNQRMERELAHHIVRCHGIPFELPPQIIPLLVDSHAFGHPTRLDYGTGHELAFVLVLWNCVASKWIKDEDDQDDLILRVFPRYMHLVNLLQRKYRLEPAGSHGVWGLDDYCFFPYLFGAAQLMGTSITPAQSLENAQSIVSDPSTTGPFDMYTYALVHVIQSKTGAPFSEHSPTLYAVSRLPNWEKAFQGLRKFFLNEVAGKRVVVQGLLMGGWCWGEGFPDTTREGHVNLLEEGGSGSTRAPWMRGR